MKASVPTPANGAGRSTANGRIFGLKKSTLSLITALAVGTPLLVACDSADAIPVNTEVTSTPAATTTEQTPAPTTTSKAPVVESTTSKAPKPEETSTSKAPKPEPTSSKETTSSAQPAPSTTSAIPAEPTEETTTKTPLPEESSTTQKPAPSTPSDSPEPSAPVEEIPEEYRKAASAAEFYLRIYDDKSYNYILERLTRKSGENLSEEAARHALDNSNSDWVTRATYRVQWYVDIRGTSYNAVFNELTGSYEQFTASEAKAALERANIDWNAEAVEAAQERIDRDSGKSAFEVFTNLTSNYNFGGFTDAQAQFGIDNATVDWNLQAAKMRDRYLGQSTAFSKARMARQLPLHGFKKTEIDYALENAPQNTWRDQAVRFAQKYTLSHEPSRTELINELVRREDFTLEEAEYAADKVGL